MENIPFWQAVRSGEGAGGVSGFLLQGRGGRIASAKPVADGSGIVAFQSDAAVPVEQKRDVYIIPETLNNNTYLTFNETAKTITIAADLSTLNKVYTNPSNTIYVPNIVAGQVITFRRKTISNTPLVTWSSGTKLTSNQLNLETTQLLYLVQEVLDRVYRQISISGDIVSQIADNAITTSKIVDLNVTTIKINDLAVTTAKLADLNVTTGKINDLAVTTAKIADYNITPAKLSNASQAWSLTGTLALTDLATSATGDKVANKNYVLDRVSKYGVITKDSTVTSNVLDTPPSIPSDANDDVSLQSGGIWFNPRDGGLRVRVLDKWVRVTGTPLNITDYISTDGTAQTKTGNLTLAGNLTVDTNTLFVDSSNNRVGVGTITPSTALEVNGTVTATAFAGNLTGTIQTADQPNITSVGTLTTATISGNLTVDTNTLFVDSSNNRVGIGKTNPSTSLDVNGTVTATGYNIQMLIPINGISFTNGQGQWLTGTMTINTKSLCLFSFNFSAYRTSGGGTLSATVTTTPASSSFTVSVVTNEANSHKASPTGYGGVVLNAGTYTVTFTCDGGTTTDSNDKGYVAVIAIPTP